MTSRFAIPIAAALMTLGLTACGGNNEQPEPPSAPVCSDQWQEGKTLPKDYSGCQASEGSGKQAAQGTSCTDGGYLIRYEDKLFAITGQTIQAGDQASPAYAEALATCTG